MTEWVYAQADSAEELAELHYFSFMKRRPEGDVEFVITVKEFASRNALQMRFYAQSDKEVNQRTAPFRPFGWGIRCCAHSANAWTPFAKPPTIRNSDEATTSRPPAACRCGQSRPRGTRRSSRLTERTARSRRRRIVRLIYAAFRLKPEATGEAQTGTARIQE